jgi:hypothetical protein
MLTDAVLQTFILASLEILGIIDLWCVCVCAFLTFLNDKHLLLGGRRYADVCPRMQLAEAIASAWRHLRPMLMYADVC